MAPFDRTIDIFVRDAEDNPIPGATIRWKINGTDAGSIESAEGRGRISLGNPLAIVEVTVSYAGITKTAQLAAAQDQFTFNFDEVNVNPTTWREIVAKHVPAIFGVLFLGMALWLGFTFGSPTPLQQRLILVLVALGGGAFATEISGMLNVNIDLGKRLVIGATGALAVFVILFFVVPAPTTP